MIAPLPPRTAAYITTGAPEGHRNEELLAAAIQCRDAGQSEVETTQLLIPRAIADGLSENEAGRTIKSAFSRSPRESITGPSRALLPGGRSLSAQERQRIEAQNAQARLKAKAAASLQSVLGDFKCGFAYYANRSPENLFNSDPREDWRLLLQLFKPDDLIWIGEKHHSANEKHSPEWQRECAGHFRRRDQWLAEPPLPTWPLTCPATFHPGTSSRCNANVLTKPYLVVESDTLNRNDVCAVFRWTEQFTRLRAIVDTAGKSLHGWFEFPVNNVLEQLAVILPGFGCDPALFGLSQPCRLPGAYRDGRYQSLLYLDLEDVK